MRWDKSGEVAQELRIRGIFGDIQPLFATRPYPGEVIHLFRVGDSMYYLFYAIEASLCGIVNPPGLETILAILDDRDRGVAALEIEAL